MAERLLMCLREIDVMCPCLDMGDHYVANLTDGVRHLSVRVEKSDASAYELIDTEPLDYLSENCEQMQFAMAHYEVCRAFGLPGDENTAIASVYALKRAGFHAISEDAAEEISMVVMHERHKVRRAIDRLSHTAGRA